MTDLETQEAIAWANKVIKATGTAYTPASRNAAAFILASRDRIEALETEVERLWAALRDVTDYGDLAAVRIARAALEARHD